MKRIFTLMLLSTMMLCAMAQGTDPVLFEINGKNYYKSQFMKEFLQSIGKDPATAPTACTYEKRKALEEYAQLYVNFQTKLTDAYALGLDTMKNLNDELKNYRKDLAAPYLIDSVTMMSLLQEAYERNHYVLHAAHILVHCAENALPEDTLKAYQHAMELYQKALTTDNFYTIAQEEMYNQLVNHRDPEMREKANQKNPMEGDLGCFTVFDMIYAFESAAYEMQPGEIHKPVRTKYGYHIIKLFDRFNHYGKAQLAHIWIAENTASAEGKIKAAYRQLNEGTDFGVVAKNYSDDRSTSNNGGIMPELSPNQLPDAYIKQIADGLQVGEYSQPFHSRFGWHIVKLLKRETMPEFESMIPYYKSRMTRGERSTKPQHIFVEQSKKKYNFVDYTTTKTSKKKNAPYAASYAQVRALITDSVFSAIFNYDSNAITDMRPLFKIGDKEYNCRNFAKYIRKNKQVRKICDLDIFTKERYQEFVNDMVLKYADSRLEIDNPEFGELIEEYRHGLMIFNYNDMKVWSRAIKDTVGFEEFYNKESVKHNYNDSADAVYFWNDRAQANIYTVSDSTILPQSKALKIHNKGMKKMWDANEMVNNLSAKIKDTTFSITSEPQLVEKGNQKLLEANEWSVGTYVHPFGKGYQIIDVVRILQPELKTREEARGFYLNDYQNYLEESNNAELHKKYNVIIHQDVLDEIIY